MPRSIASILFALTTATMFAASSRAVSAQKTSDSAGVRIYDYRRQTSSPVAFLAADTPFVRLRAYNPSDTGVFGATKIALLKNGGLAVGISHSVTTVNRPLTAPGNSGQDSITKPVVPQSAPSAQSRTMDVRLFDANGKFQARLGSYGRELGQFASVPMFIQEAPNGEILVTTSRPELLRFKPSGELVRGVRFGYANRGTFNAGMLADQSIVISVEVVQPSIDVPVSVPGAVVKKAQFQTTRYDTTGGMIEQYPIFSEYTFFWNGAGRPPGPGSPWPYSTYDVVVTGPKNIWRFDPIKWELQNFDARGKLVSITRPALLERLKAAVLGQLVTGGVPYPTLIVDDEGRLWMDVGENRSSSQLNLDQRVWDVYDTSGKQLGSVMIPVGLRVLAIQQSALLGVYWEGPPKPPMVAGFRVRAVGRR